MYAIKQVYINTQHPERNVVQLLCARYKTERGAHKGAKKFNWVCKKGSRVIESSTAQVIKL